MDGTDEALINEISLNSGQYALVLWDDGEDDLSGPVLKIFVDDPAPTKTDDALALMIVDDYRDAVAWTNNDETVASGEITDIQTLFSQGQWPNATDIAKFNSVCVDISELEPGMSLSRFLSPTGGYEDTNSKNDWYISSASSPGGASDITLPVELSAFFATISEDDVILKWRTESEVENLGFKVFKNNQEIGFVKGAGTDATPHDYRFVDSEVEVGKTYFYYLEDIDFGGKKNKSFVLKIKISKQFEVFKPEFELLQNFPNPFNPETWIPFKLAKDTDVTIRIYNTVGKLIRTLYLGKMTTGYHEAYWRGDKVSSGVYFYNLTAGNFSATKKLVILK